MIPKLITENVWGTLTNAVESSNRKSFVAVAYFGKGGAKRLPLIEGSKLVVDASDHAVQNGQTHPDDLLTLYNKGVEIYSCERLHAKIYIVGSKCFIGSANVSSNSADKLKEVLLQTTDKKVVNDAKEYILGLCSVENEVGPGQLERLQKIYKPPIIPGHNKLKNKPVDTIAENSNYFIYRFKYYQATDYDLEQMALGMKEASKMRTNKTRHIVEEIRHTGKLPIKLNDMLFQVVDENGEEYIYPAAKVIYVKNVKKGKILYVERPISDKKSLTEVSKGLGAISLKKLNLDDNIPNIWAEKINLLLK